jgi:hypothetical protein
MSGIAADERSECKPDATKRERGSAEPNSPWQKWGLAPLIPIFDQKP